MRAKTIFLGLVVFAGCTRGAFYPRTSSGERPPVDARSVLVMPDACPPEADVIGTVYVEADGPVALVDELRARAARAGGSAICAIQMGEASFWVAELFGLFASGGRGLRHARATVITSTTASTSTIGIPSEGAAADGN